MKRSFIYRNFKYWIKKNRKRFLVEPYVWKVRKDHFNIRFRGIGVYIQIIVSKDMISWWSYCPKLASEEHSESYNDWHGDFDVFIKKCHKGYYLDDCLDTKLIYYSSRNELFETGVWEPVLEWFNEKIYPGNSIIFFDGYTRIYPFDNLSEKEKENYFYTHLII